MQQPALGKWVAERRHIQGVTQQELAARCGVTVRTVQRIESGAVMPRKYTLGLLTQALGGEPEGVPPRRPGGVVEAFRELFNFKTYKMAKISFLSSVVLATGLSAALFVAEGRAQAQKTETPSPNPTFEAADGFKGAGLIVGDSSYYAVEPIPGNENYHMIHAGAGKEPGSGTGWAGITHRGDRFKLTDGNVAYLNGLFFATLEKGDTVMIPWRENEKWTIRKHYPMEFRSQINRNIRYEAPEKPSLTSSATGPERNEATYIFENGLEIEEKSGGLHVNGERKFDLHDGDTVVIDRAWNVSVKRK